MSKNNGTIIEWTDKEGVLRKGFVYAKDQNSVQLAERKIVVTKVDDKLQALDVPKVVKHDSTLTVIGFLD